MLKMRRVAAAVSRTNSADSIQDNLELVTQLRLTPAERARQLEAFMSEVEKIRGIARRHR